MAACHQSAQMIPYLVPAGLSPSKAWLAIGIPTFPRHNDTDYLTSTLDSLLSELPSEPADPFHDRIHVLVMNNKPGQHPVYTKVQRRIQQGARDPDDTFAQKALQYVEFIDNPGTVEDPTPADKPEPNDFDNPTNIPGRFDLHLRRHHLQSCSSVQKLSTAVHSACSLLNAVACQTFHMQCNIVALTGL